jgi:uncharacterized protein YerC
VAENASLRGHAQRGSRLKEQCDQLLESLRGARASHDALSADRDAARAENATLQQRVRVHPMVRGDATYNRVAYCVPLHGRW